MKTRHHRALTLFMLLCVAVMMPFYMSAKLAWQFVAKTTPVFSQPSTQSVPIADNYDRCYLYLSKGMMVLGEPENDKWVRVMFQFPGMTSDFFSGYVPVSCLATEERLGRIANGTYTFRNPKLCGMTFTVEGERGARLFSSIHSRIGSDKHNYKVVAPDDRYLYLQYYNPTWKTYQMLFSLVKIDGKYYPISYDYDDLYNDPAHDDGFFMPADNE